MAAADMPSQSAPMVCHVCMEVYRKPKFLACFHTFCQQCIQDWADQNRNKGLSTFPCPVCRKEASLPRGGVSKLQTNFYFSEKDLEKARAGKLCLLHDNKELELFCLPCKQVICLKCKVLYHESHQVLDVTEAVCVKKKELMEGRKRVQATLTMLEKLSAENKTRQKRNEKQLSTAKAVVRNMIVGTARIIQQLTENRLQSCHDYLARYLAVDLQALNTFQQEMKVLDEQVSEAANGEDVQKMVTAANELNSGKGSKKSVHRMINRDGSHPSLYLLLTFISMFAVLVLWWLVGLFNSNSETMEMKSFKMVPSVPFKIVKQFKCAKETDTEVYSLCALNNGPVVVSYTQRGLREDVASQSFTKTGETGKTFDSAVGRAQWTRVDQRCVNFPDQTTTFSKSDTLFRLSRTWPGTGVIEQATAGKTAGFMDLTFLFTINVRAHWAFDGDATGKHFVVIEEGQSPNLQRTVKIFRKPNPDPIATYLPHDTTFQPVDVCFFKIVGKEVLLVADELNDHIHVVAVEHHAIKFLGYLESHCPQSKAPTAMNVDDKGDLWLACQGGNIMKTEYSFLRVVRFLFWNTFRNTRNP